MREGRGEPRSGPAGRRRSPAGEVAPVSSGQGPSDGDVVRRVLAGNVELYAVLVRRYRDRYARYAARMLGSEDAAEDAVQDALVRAYDQLAQCREPEKFAGWFFLILRNRCFAERRRRGRQARPLGVQDELIVGSDRSDGPVERAEDRRTLERALDRLTRSEEHTSELQSQSNLVCRLLLEKKKKKHKR